MTDIEAGSLANSLKMAVEHANNMYTKFCALERNGFS
jgi:hypothetical protein